MGLNFARPYTAPPSKTKRDWAGVEGHYHRLVSFLDYRDLFSEHYIRRSRHRADGFCLYRL